LYEFAHLAAEEGPAAERTTFFRTLSLEQQEILRNLLLQIALQTVNASIEALNGAIVNEEGGEFSLRYIPGKGGSGPVRLTPLPQISESDFVPVRFQRHPTNIHHVPQPHIGERLVEGYDRGTAIGVAVPEYEHRRLPHVRSETYNDFNQAVEDELRRFERFTGMPPAVAETLRTQIGNGSPKV
jgi:hypothetical protein